MIFNVILFVWYFQRTYSYEVFNFFQEEQTLGSDRVISICAQTNVLCSNSTSTCNCAPVSINSTAPLSGVDFPVPDILVSFSEPNPVSLEFWRLGYQPSNSKRDGSVQIDGVDYIKLIDNSLIISRTFDSNLCITLVQTPFYHFSGATTREMVISNEIAYSAQVISVDIVCEGSLVIHTQFQNYPSETCQNAFITDFHCLSNSMKALSVIGVVFIGLSLVISMIMLGFYIKNRVVLRQLDESISLSTSSEDGEEEPPLKEAPISRVRKGKTVKFSLDMCLLLVCLICLATPVSACDKSIILSSGYTECLHKTDDTVECSLRTSVDMPFSGVSGETCVSFVDPVSNAVVSTVKVKLLSDPYVTDLIPLYFTTPAVTYSVSSVKYCSGSQIIAAGVTNAQCTSGRCINLPAPTSTGGYFCVPACGCAGCSCVSCDSGCTVVRYVVLPAGSVVKVLKPIFTRKQMSFRTEINQTVSSFIAQTSFPVEVNNITFQVLTDWNTPTFFTDFFVGEFQFTNPSYFLVKSQYVSPFNVPTPYKLGALQSSSAAGIAQGTYIHTGVFPTFYAGSSSINFYTTPESFDLNLVSSPLLPQSDFAGYTWFINSTHSIARPVSDNAISVRMEIQGDFKITANVDQVCPIVTSDVVLSGCFLCETGYQVKVSLKSSRFPGLVYIESDLDLEPKVIYLSDQANEFIFTGYSFDRDISSTFVNVIGTHCTTNFQVTGELNDPPILNSTRGEIQEQIDSTLGKQDFSSWWDSLTGSLAVYKFVFITTIVLTSLVILGALAMLAWKVSQIPLFGYKML